MCWQNTSVTSTRGTYNLKDDQLHEYRGGKYSYNLKDDLECIYRFSPCFYDENESRYKMYLGKVDVITKPLAFESKLLAQMITEGKFQNLSHEALNDNPVYFSYLKDKGYLFMHFFYFYCGWKRMKSVP